MIAAVMLLLRFARSLSTWSRVSCPISDRIGRRLPILIGIALYVGASLACAFASTFELLVAARAAQGAAGAAVVCGALALLAVWGVYNAILLYRALASKAIGRAPGGFPWIREGNARLDRDTPVTLPKTPATITDIRAMRHELTNH